MATAPSLILAVNVSTGKFIQSNGSVSKLDVINREVNTVAVYLRSTNPTGIPGLNTTTDFDMTGWDGIRMGICSASPGDDVAYENSTTGKQLTLTPQENWTYVTTDPENPYFIGEFNTNTPAIQAWLADQDDETCGDAYLFISLVKGADVKKIIDYEVCGTPNIEIRNITDTGSGSGTTMTGQTPVINDPVFLIGGHRYALTEIEDNNLTFSRIA